MEEAKKKRASKARVVTRRTNELLNGIKCCLQGEEVLDKMNNLKYVLGELGSLQDEVLSVLESEDITKPEVQVRLTTENNWYDTYDNKVNLAIREARKYIAETKEAEAKPRVKVKKLEVPKFTSEPKDFHKWKETFERYTGTFDNSTKYDYLYTYTTGEAHTCVANRRDYSDAMKKLEEKYGNVHDLISTLVDEVKGLSITRRGDLRTFENLSLRVNEFHDRLVLMGKESECENSYILKEIEGKLCPDDYHKWLESRGSGVDKRTVKDLLQWLEIQTRLRRIVGRSTVTAYQQGPGMTPRRRPPGFTSNPMESASAICRVCGEEHGMPECPSYLRLSLNDRWEKLKELRVCFICLERGHRRQNCSAPLCNACNGPHHLSLHRYSTNDSVNSVSAIKSQGPKRCFLPVVEVKLSTDNITLTAKAVLDTCSELNIITSRCCERLKLRGTPTQIAITGAGGNVTYSRTQLVEVFIIDNFGEKTLLECIVFNKACGKSLRINEELLRN